MPKWWAISCTTVIATSSTTSSSVSQIAQGRVAVDGDPVGQHAGVVPAAVGQRVPLVEAEQVRLAARRVVLDQDDHVVHQVEQLLGDLVERLADQLLEALPAHLDRHVQRGSAHRRGTARQGSWRSDELGVEGDLDARREPWRSGSPPWRLGGDLLELGRVDAGDVADGLVRSIRVTAKPASTLSNCTLAVVSTEVGVKPASARPLENAIEKQPACAARSAPRGWCPRPLEARREGVGTLEGALAGRDGAGAGLEVALPAGG